jgi:hypothetical protein
MPAIVTNSHRVVAADYFQNDVASIPTYVFIGGTSEWVDENNPPDVADSVQGQIFSYDEIIGAKRIQSDNIISCIPRIDWEFEKVYDEYRDDVNLIDSLNPETNDFYKFYVITDEFNVYKCLSNNYRAQSTIKPSGTSVNPIETPDGYKWKYMYTVKSTDAFSFMTPNYIPCYTAQYDDGGAQWLTQQSAIPGTIDNIYITDGGAQYTTTNPPTITITGDGTGCQAVAVIDNDSGTITAINIIDPGKGYTTASVSIDSNGDGVGAQATPVISPIQGHGYDARVELGAIFKMIRVVLDGSEGGVLATNVSYRKAGIVYLPESVTETGLRLAIRDANLYEVGQTVTGATSGATGDITIVDKTNNILYINNVVGSFIQFEQVSSTAYNSTDLNHAQLVDNMPLINSVVSSSDIKPDSGELLYISTREKVLRGLNQVEEIRFIINF